MIYIRTDANDKIATGHVMRCLTIAKELTSLGERVTFLVSDENSLPLIKEQGFKVLCLHTTWDHLDNTAEYDALKSILGRDDKILIDTYSITNAYVLHLKKYTKVICFDDMFQERYDADMIINYNLFYERFPYDTRYQQSQTKLLLGGDYVPLREQFRNVTWDPADKPNTETNVLLICGGADPLHMISSFLEWLKSTEEDILRTLRWHVITGRYNSMYPQILECTKSFLNVTLYQNVQEMANLMNQCDICISAASTVLYECCAMRLPTIFFITAKDQEFDADLFSAKQTMLYAGDYRKEPSTVHETIAEQLKNLLDNTKLRATMKEKMKIIDGFGSVRIATEILTL